MGVEERRSTGARQNQVPGHTLSLIELPLSSVCDLGKENLNKHLFCNHVRGLRAMGLSGSRVCRRNRSFTLDITRYLGVPFSLVWEITIKTNKSCKQAHRPAESTKTSLHSTQIHSHFTGDSTIKLYYTHLRHVAF